jgi:hypothetical protein
MMRKKTVPATTEDPKRDFGDEEWIILTCIKIIPILKVRIVKIW